MTINEQNKLVIKAEAYENDKSYSKAIEIYNQILSADQNNAKILAFRGYNHFYLKCFKKALNDFNEALKIKPDAPSTLFYKARTLEELGRLDEALEAYFESIELAPEADAYINAGLIYKFKGDLRQSRIFLENALALDPKCELAVNLLNSLNE